MRHGRGNGHISCKEIAYVSCCEVWKALLFCKPRIHFEVGIEDGSLVPLDIGSTIGLGAEEDL